MTFNFGIFGFSESAEAFRASGILIDSPPQIAPARQLSDGTAGQGRHSTGLLGMTLSFFSCAGTSLHSMVAAALTIFSQAGSSNTKVSLISVWRGRPFSDRLQGT